MEVDSSYSYCACRGHVGPCVQCPSCCDMGQNDTIGKIELNPLSSCQVTILITRMTFNCSSSCLMS